MRISDAVKKYQDETKDRIFNSIIGSEEAQMYSPVSSYGPNENSEATSERAAVRRDWTGLAAIAACAVMAVGVGTMMMKGSVPQPENRNGAIASEDGSSDEAVPESIATQIGDIRDEDYYDEYGMTFGDLLERSYEVIDLKVEGHLPVSISRDAAVSGYVDYAAEQEYDVGKSGIVFKSGSISATRTQEKYYRQYFSQEALNAADKGASLPIAGDGERLLVFVKAETESDPSIGYARVLTTQDSIYRFDIMQHKYVNIVSPGKFEDEVNGYVLDTLAGMTPAAVEKWTAYHRMSLVTVEEYSDSIPGGKIIDLEWDDSRSAYVLTVSSGS